MILSEDDMSCKKPEALIEFLRKYEKKGELPAAFRSQDDEFLISIQYVLADSEERSSDSNNMLFKFAVSTDGWDLLVDLEDKELEILQDEMGDIDSIDITLIDLLNAKVEKL